MILYFRRAQRWGRWEIKKERRGWACRGERSGGSGEKREEVVEKERERGRQSHLVCLISGRIIGLAGGKLLYQPPKGESDFLKQFNKLEECDCPDSTTVTVLIRHRALSEPAIPEPSTPCYHSWYWHAARESKREARLQDLSSADQVI